MEILKDIVQIINKRKLQNIEILDKSLLSSKDSLYSNFYSGLEENKINTEEEAIRYLYGKYDKDAINSFRQFKSRFKKRILNTLFFIDVNNQDYESDVQRHYFECLKSLQVINIIQKYSGNQNLVYNIIKDYYTVAARYGFHDILKEYCYRLCTYYTIRGETDKLEEYKKRFQQQRQYCTDEEDAYLLFNEINSCTISVKASVQTFLESKIEEINKIAEKSDSFLVQGYTYISRLIYYNYLQDIKEMNKQCEALLTFVEDKDNVYKQSFKGIASLFKIETFLQMHMYNEGIEYIDNNIKNFLGINYFRAVEYKLKYALNLQDIDLAEDIISSTLKHKLFESAPNTVKEKWLIFNGYDQFYKSYLRKEKYTYNIGKLTNQLPTYYHDKSGYNFSLIVLQILFHLAKKEHDSAATKIQGLSIYKTRYFNEPRYSRAKLFIKTLMNIEKNNFNRRAAQKLIQQFSVAPASKGYINDHEILLFETILKITGELV